MYAVLPGTHGGAAYPARSVPLGSVQSQNKHVSAMNLIFLCDFINESSCLVSGRRVITVLHVPWKIVSVDSVTVNTEGTNE